MHFITPMHDDHPNFLFSGAAQSFGRMTHRPSLDLDCMMHVELFWERETRKVTIDDNAVFYRRYKHNWYSREYLINNRGIIFSSTVPQELYENFHLMRKQLYFLNRYGARTRNMQKNSKLFLHHLVHFGHELGICVVLRPLLLLLLLLCMVQLPVLLGRRVGVPEYVRQRI